MYIVLNDPGSLFYLNETSSSGGDSSSNIETSGASPNGDDQNDSNLSDKPGKIADKLGRSRKEIKDAIHKVKDDMSRGGPKRNPDVYVDIRTGEVYPKAPNVSVGDSIGNIFDYLH